MAVPPLPLLKVPFPEKKSILYRRAQQLSFTVFSKSFTSVLAVPPIAFSFLTLHALDDWMLS